MKPGDRVRVVVSGPCAGMTGTVRRESADHPGWWIVKLESGEARIFSPDDVVILPPPLRIPLLEYLDQLEATAKAAIDADFGFHDGDDAALAHRSAFEPRAALALIARMRSLARLAVGRKADELLIEVPE